MNMYLCGDLVQFLSFYTDIYKLIRQVARPAAVLASKLNLF